ncbi:ATP-binding cassette domain-containing protein [Streptomyces sp. WMMC897]|uniref:ATP-binding cassette domain-containing protein n=1 Tax=Streptomyces sp. WMMC897 TaxID=3014782 RepID=UPI0022B707A7|nr:ABC transporter ATP-binding protein [Streptomyces sp. WMMC897]MCZ7416557.1 ABC transporter ATP-binding protein [Streptomyces sp. WMMC897]
MAPAPPRPAGSGTSGRRLLLRTAWHARFGTAGVLLCATLSAATALALPAVLGHTLDLLMEGRPGAGRWLALCVTLMAADVLLEAALAYLAGAVGGRSTAWLRTRGLQALLAAAPHRLSRVTPGDAATLLSARTAEAGAGPAAGARLVASLLTPAGGLIALFLIDVRTGLAFAVGLPALVLLLRAFARRSAESVTHYQRVQSDIASRLLDALAGAHTIAAAGTEDQERRRVLAPLAELGLQGRRMWSAYGRAVARGGVLMPLLVTAVLAVGGLGLTEGRLSVGELLAAARYAALAAGAGAVAGPLQALVQGRVAAVRLAELLAVPPVTYGTTPLPAAGPGRLELRRVRVSREGRTLLDDIDLTVPGGVTAAVVGHSGAGKSTLAAIAGRLADPDGGRVLLDGVELASVPRAALRREVGYAFSRPVLFGDTVQDALAWGAEAAPPARVVAAARAAGADGFVRRLPHAYATPLALAPVSGGESQRLGLARAFAHAGRLLILDDATSSLDTATEREVDRALAREVRPGTRLIVARRQATAARADLVVWLDGGRVRAVAPHAELRHDPHYRAVFAEADAGPDAESDAESGAESGAEAGAATADGRSGA